MLVVVWRCDVCGDHRASTRSRVRRAVACARGGSAPWRRRSESSSASADLLVGELRRCRAARRPRGVGNWELHQLLVEVGAERGVFGAHVELRSTSTRRRRSSPPTWSSRSTSMMRRRRNRCTPGRWRSVGRDSAARSSNRSRWRGLRPPRRLHGSCASAPHAPGDAVHTMPVRSTMRRSCRRRFVGVYSRHRSRRPRPPSIRSARAAVEMWRRRRGAAPGTESWRWGLGDHDGIADERAADGGGRLVPERSAWSSGPRTSTPAVRQHSCAARAIRSA